MNIELESNTNKLKKFYSTDKFKYKQIDEDIILIENFFKNI